MGTVRWIKRKYGIIRRRWGSDGRGGDGGREYGCMIRRRRRGGRREREMNMGERDTEVKERERSLLVST